MAARKTAAELLVSRGILPDRKTADSYILAGQVYSGGQRVTTGGQLLKADAPLTVRGADRPFTSKGGFKLNGALKDFGVSVEGRVCIDAGASTGGFSDCLLKNGAALVYAVDVGYGQLMGSLRQNQRLVNLERTNIGDDRLLRLSPRPDLGTVDLSYLSLRKGIPAFAAVLHEQGELICLVKPLFEVDDSEARRTGVLDPDTYPGILRDLIRNVNALPYATVVNVTHSCVRGNSGTLEFFLHVRLGTIDIKHNDWSVPIETAVRSALALQPFDMEREANVFER